MCWQRSELRFPSEKIFWDATIVYASKEPSASPTTREEERQEGGVANPLHGFALIVDCTHLRALLDITGPTESSLGVKDLLYACVRRVAYCPRTPSRRIDGFARFVGSLWQDDEGK
jgi:hypothetical protein